MPRSSSAPMKPASSPAPACPSTVAWACRRRPLVTKIIGGSDMSKKPVVVYGVSGYTGRLVCEYLREYNIPFIAAGRDKTRGQEVVDRIPGIETADYEVREVEHNRHALAELFRGAEVVSNMVGPFIKYG